MLNLFFKSKPKPTIEVEKTIDAILKETTYRYPSSMEFTENALKKCVNLFHYLELYRNAFSASMHPEYNGDNFLFVPKEVIDLLYRETVKSLQYAIRNLSVKEIEKAHELLECNWRDRKNSKEREMLRSILEVHWRKYIQDSLDTLKAGGTKDVKLYEQLYFECKDDDPNILNIAREINRLSFINQ